MITRQKKNRIQGTNFENRVKAILKKEGWNVIRRGRSAFPDLHCWKLTEGVKIPNTENRILPDKMFQEFEIMEVECKSSLKYKDPLTLMNSDEKRLAKGLLAAGKCSKFMLAYREKYKKITHVKFKELC